MTDLRDQIVAQARILRAATKANTDALMKLSRTKNAKHEQVIAWGEEAGRHLKTIHEAEDQLDFLLEMLTKAEGEQADAIRPHGEA